MFAALIPFASFLFEEKVYVVEWWPRGLLAWIFLGLLAGWLAGKLSRGRGYGCIADIVLGLLGSVIGGWVFTKLGIFGGGFIFSLAAATLGAVILVAIVHLLIGGSKN
jgi:uncharacterized membrane protein YeaQ/YmgE (transglycosylase-associated protein family)